MSPVSTRRVTDWLIDCRLGFYIGRLAVRRFYLIDKSIDALIDVLLYIRANDYFPKKKKKVTGGYLMDKHSNQPTKRTLLFYNRLTC